MRRGWEERNRRRRRETIRGGEGEETLTANIHPPPTPPTGLSNTLNAQLGRTSPSQGEKQKLGEATRARVKIWKSLEKRPLASAAHYFWRPGTSETVYASFF